MNRTPNTPANGEQILTDERIDKVMDTFGKNGLDYPSRTRLHDFARAIEADLRAALAAPAIPTVDRNAVPQPAVPKGYVLALQAVVELPDGGKELGYTLLDGVGIFTAAEEVHAAINELSLPLGWVSMTTDQLLPGWMLPAAPAVQPAAQVAVGDDQRDAARWRELNTPEITDFLKGVEREAMHQRDRWGADHDEGKAPEDWFWLLGYLGGKALHAAKNGNTDKALHHTISSAAALLNWHAAILGTHTAMRPGIATPATDKTAEKSDTQQEQK